MFDNLIADYHRHESTILNPSLWAVLNYRFGNWASILHSAPISVLMSVIYGNSIIGDRVRIQHNVTLARNLDRGGAPTIGNDVFIGAVILGGIKIGDGARVAANSLVITDVPPGATGVPARIMKYTGRPTKDS